MKLRNILPRVPGRRGSAGTSGRSLSSHVTDARHSSSPSLGSRKGADGIGNNIIGSSVGDGDGDHTAGVSDGASSSSSIISGSGDTTSHIIDSETHREYYLSVSDSISSGGGRVAGGTGFNYNNYNTHNANNNQTSSVTAGSFDNNSVNDFISTTENRTLSDFFSLVGPRAEPVYNSGGADVNSGVGTSTGGSSGGLGYHLGLDRILHGNSVNSYDGFSSSGTSVDVSAAAAAAVGEGDVLDYNYNYNNGHVLFDNGIEYLHGNFSDLDSFSQLLLNRMELKMGDELTRYLTPAIIVLGNISNTVAFLVLRRKKFKHSSVAFYMRAYALANLCFLDLMWGIAWLCFVLEIQYPAHRSDWSCRLWTFIANVITYSSIWFVVIMSIDRFVFINFPSKASGYCKLFTAKGITTFIIICLIVVSIHAMWTFELQPQGCWVSHNKDDLHTLTWPWWSAALYSYIPLLLLLILIITQSICYIVKLFLKRPFTPPDARQNGNQDTFVLPVFVITVACFFLTIPSIAINLLDIHLPSNLLRVDVIAKIELTKKITEALSSFNNSLLGIVLFVLSPSFIQESLVVVRMMFCCVRSRTLKVFEMRTISQSDHSSPHVQVDYELCNNNDENIATDV